jgi:hypothetical protein
MLTENRWDPHRRSRTCVPWALMKQEPAHGQTNQALIGYDSVDLKPPPAARLPVGRGEACKIRVCWRMLSVFKFTQVPGSHVVFVSWTARPCVAVILRNVVRRFSARLLLAPSQEFSLHFQVCPVFPGVSSTLFPIVIGRTAFYLLNSVGILLPLRLLTEFDQAVDKR